VDLGVRYWRSEDRWVARGLLAVVVALNLGIVYVSVLLSKSNNDFYNALQDGQRARAATTDGWRAAASLAILNEGLLPDRQSSTHLSLERAGGRPGSGNT
jgi:ABC-type uncharacterized transport system fused permease/ATPase subunit